MVTAELAVAIPAVVVVLVVCLSGVAAVVDQVRVVDAARLASRAAARGDDVGSAAALARRAAPSGAQVRISAGGGEAVVHIEARTGGWGGIVPRWTVSADARTPVEEGVSRP
jgi:hypothetical protein